MQFEIKYSKHFDLLFHVLAYLKVDNASDLYDKQYIERMMNEKQGFYYDIISDINTLQDYYNQHFERLMMINFLPFHADSYDHMKTLFHSYEKYTSEDLSCFIEPFIKVLDKEMVFYFHYWGKLHAKHRRLRLSIEENLRDRLSKYSCIFRFYHKSVRIYLSYSMTRNGRGFNGIPSCFSADVPFPGRQEDAEDLFFQILHEITHQFTDELLRAHINMHDDSHMLSEKLVFLADYLLIKSIHKKDLDNYLKWAMNDKENVDEAKFLREFKVNEKMEKELIRLADKIVCINRTTV